jgi:hypothetical protein
MSHDLESRFDRAMKRGEKQDRIKIEHNYKTGEHTETNIDAMKRKPKHKALLKIKK